MNRKNISLIILLILLVPFLYVPKVKADGSIDAQEVFVEWRTGSWVGRGASIDGKQSVEDDCLATYNDLAFSFSSYEVDQINVTNMRAYIYWFETSDGFSRNWFFSAWEYVTQTNAGTRVHTDSWLLQNYEGTGHTWVTRTFSEPWSFTADKFFFGVASEDQSGNVYLEYETSGDADSAHLYDFDATAPNPFVESVTYSGREGDIQIIYWGYKNKLTTFNQYFGDSENYTARRDVNYTFPTGVSNKKYRITFPTGEALINITYSNGGLWNQKLSESDYSIEDYNATHKLITIENTPLSIYGSEFRIFTQSYNYFYNLYGPFSENGTKEDAKNVIATRTDASEEIELDGYYLYADDDPTIMFTWILSGGETRRYYPLTPTENIYIFEPDGTYATYGFDIRDYPGIIGTNVCFLEAIRSVNGTDRVVERNIIWNTHSPVPMILTKNKVYLLRVRLEDESYYTFGYFTPGDYVPPTLSIMGLGWSDYYQPISKWVHMGITRPNSTHIKMVYADNLLITVGVEAKITLRNGTEVWSDYQSENSYTFNWYGADSETEYVATLTAEHALYGIIDHSVTFIGEIDPDAPPDFSAIGVDPSLLSIFLILAVAGTVSRWNRTAGMFAASAIASLLTVIEWIAIPYELLAAAFALSIISGLGGR